MLNKVHIVSFDIPFPPNYGGVIDVYYKCKALHELGVEIELHCFEYGRNQAEELTRYCKKVHYYKRRKFVNPLSSAVPYIVKTRIHKHLLRNLKADHAPIIFEGLHTTWPMVEGSIDLKRCFVRTHNIEHEYYKRLESVESSAFKRAFFKNESRKLAGYEKVLARAKGVFAISKFDASHFSKVNSNTYLVSAFHESDEVSIKLGTGEYVLYHGNLSVGENDHAACYLASEVFPKLAIPAIIAGNKPSSNLRKLCADNGIELRDNVNNIEIVSLVEHAQINVLPTFQKTGIKLKLLNALFRGRHCVVNGPMVEDTGLEQLCHISNHAEGLALIINEISSQPFTKSDINERINTLQDFGNKSNATRLLEKLID